MDKFIFKYKRCRKETFSNHFSYSVLLLSFFILIGCSSDSGGGSSSTTPDTETSDGGTGDGKPGAEGLSGLARSFFYAGARSLLVSHWPVETNSAVELTTGIFEEMKTNPEIGRAEALRRSRIRLINNQDHPEYAHPYFWAPFVVVGEGAHIQTPN